MVNRVETIELTGWEQSEVIEEFENDVKKKRYKGWELLSYSRYYTNEHGFCIKYEMVRFPSYNV